MELNLTDIFQLFEISNKYSLIQMKKSVQTFMFQNIKTIFKSDVFLNTEKSVVKEIIAIGETFAIKYEEMFQAAYEWSENQAVKKQMELNVEAYNMNDAIKVEMQEFLPYIQFNKMEVSFFTKYVVDRDFIFTFNELSDILESVHSNVKVKITNGDGQSIYGLLPKENNAVSVIKSLRNRYSFPLVFSNTNCEKPSSRSLVFWKKNYKKPTTPSPLKKRIGAKCYLVYPSDGYFGISTDPTDSHYLLAEMFSESDFEFTGGCKIEIV
uniref:BACK domain-containing protein n=1 Tax=Panagrolaimus davidi TaxID=227884 RepID=A0A914PBS7_9BILA